MEAWGWHEATIYDVATFEKATEIANTLTKRYGVYITAVKWEFSGWGVTNKYDPTVIQLNKSDAAELSN